MNARLALILSLAITSCAQIGSAQFLGPADKAEPDTLKVPPIVYAGNDDTLFLFHALFFRKYLEREFEALSAVCQTPSLPEWVRRTLLGRIEIARAWEDRGSGWASDVKKEGWKGFEKHLQIARDELTL